MKITDRLAPAGEAWDFGVTVEAIRLDQRAKNDARRFKIAAAVLAMIVSGAAFLGIYGIWVGNLNVVAGYWSATGPIFGTIIGYYFGKAGDTS
jgi:hypothetical protein